MPHAGAAHGKATQRDAVGVDLIRFLDGCDGLENVRLSRPLIGVVAAAEQPDLNGTGQVWTGRAPLRECADEFDLIIRYAASVFDDVQRPRSRAVIVVRNSQAIWLHRPIHSR